MLLVWSPQLPASDEHGRAADDNRAAYLFEIASRDFELGHDALMGLIEIEVPSLPSRGMSNVLGGILVRTAQQSNEFRNLIINRFSTSAGAVLVAQERIATMNTQLNAIEVDLWNMQARAEKAEAAVKVGVENKY